MTQLDKYMLEFIDEVPGLSRKGIPHRFISLSLQRTALHRRQLLSFPSSQHSRGAPLRVLSFQAVNGHAGTLPPHRIRGFCITCASTHSFRDLGYKTLRSGSDIFLASWSEKYLSLYSFPGRKEIMRLLISIVFIFSCSRSLRTWCDIPLNTI